MLNAFIDGMFFLLVFTVIVMLVSWLLTFWATYIAILIISVTKIAYDSRNDKF
jgi:hypothetical protein